MSKAFPKGTPKIEPHSVFVFKSGFEEPILTPDFMKLIAKNEPKWRK